MTKSIAQKAKKDKFFIYAVVFLSLVFVALIAVFLIENKNQKEVIISVPEAGKYPPIVEGSKNSHRYYFPWCGVPRKLGTSTKITFRDSQTAEKAGYVAGKGCQGL